MNFENELELWAKIDEVQSEIAILRSKKFAVSRRKIRTASVKLAKLYKEMRDTQVDNEKAFEKGKDVEEATNES